MRRGNTPLCSLLVAVALGAAACRDEGHLPPTVYEARFGAPRPGASEPALEPRGPPLEGRLGEWVYTEFPDTQCRDGSPAGVAVNLGASDKLIVYLEGGGWCIDEQTCALNPSRASDMIDWLGWTFASGGMFDRSRPDNPVRDWNFVYVPYCTGDLHGGANPAADVPGVGPQKFVGRLNLLKFLKRIAPTFEDASDVLLTGSSAGGFGVILNSLVVQRAFPDVKVKAIADSGPLLSKAIYAECLQEKQRELWGLEQTILAECGAACPNRNDYALDFALFVARSLSDRPSGLVESTGDWAVRAFYATGNDDCTGVLDLLDPQLPVSLLRTELLSLRERVRPISNFSTFFADDAAHTWLWIAVPEFTGDFYEGRAGGVRFLDWFSKIVSGEHPGHAGP